MLINLGYGLQGIMKLILPQKLICCSIILHVHFPSTEESLDELLLLKENWYFYIWQGESKPFKPYNHRYHVPHKASGSTAPFWYSIKRASSYIIVLASYSAYELSLNSLSALLFLHLSSVEESSNLLITNHPLRVRLISISIKMARILYPYGMKSQTCTRGYLS
ncbi:putative Acid phosphatase [Rosa chinensis]|uniref:Putative Acid phosphatase n=1 Tax=Rosa chinensis TaxID=74649 RepID=A0A2P6PPQ5_ROSCH|nr:putative Acid phosphatase [Rosa chinensis]